MKNRFEPNKKEIIKTILMLLLIVIIAAFCIHKLTSGETLLQYQEKTSNYETQTETQTETQMDEK